LLASLTMHADRNCQLHCLVSSHTTPLRLRRSRSGAELVSLLDRDIAWRSVHVRLRIESTFIRYTCPLTRPALFVALAAAYIVAFGLLAWQQSFRIPAEDFTTCNAVFWSSDARCGLDGVACGPFTNETYEARCPAGCLGLELLNPRLVGNEVAYLRPLVVGGGDANGTYRGDSFICAAALHAYVGVSCTHGAGLMASVVD
jgi:hypothetical protein